MMDVYLDCGHFLLSQVIATAMGNLKLFLSIDEVPLRMQLIFVFVRQIETADSALIKGGKF